MTLPTVIAQGNLTADPELKFTNNNHAMAKFRIACNDRRKNPTTGEWEDGDTTFLSVTAWRQTAEAVADTLSKGTAVVVIGKLKSRSYEDPKTGEQRTVFEVDAESVATDTSRAMKKTTRSSSAPADDPWAIPNRNSDLPF